MLMYVSVYDGTVVNIQVSGSVVPHSQAYIWVCLWIHHHYIMCSGGLNHIYNLLMIQLGPMWMEHLNLFV